MYNKGTVLYIGGFELPDKNAAAQRVIPIGKILREIGYRVVFVGLDKETKNTNIELNKNTYFDFECYAASYPKRIVRWVIHLVSARQYIRMIKHLDDVKIVVFYNFQSIAMKRIMRYSKRNGIKCVADVTEWYQPGGSFVHKLFKKLDTDFRMKSLHKKCNGIIAISDYLFQFYRSCVNTVQIPPIVDISDAKWEKNLHENKSYTFVYAGKATDNKERLDLIVDAMNLLKQEYPDVSMQIVGLTRDEYLKIYRKEHCSDSIQFIGRVSHPEAIKAVCKAKWTVIARQRTKVVEAGFPTKVVESISCGTPVCANKFSNISDYLDENDSILCDSVEEIYHAMKKAVESENMTVDRTKFSYKKYEDQIKSFIGLL